MVKVEPSTSSGLSFLLRGALAQIGDATLQAEEIQLVGILQHGNDQSPIERDRDPDIDVAMIANAFAFQRSVHDGKLLQRENRGTGEKWHEGQPGAVTLFKSGFVFVAQLTMRVMSTSNMQ